MDLCFCFLLHKKQPPNWIVIANAVQWILTIYAFASSSNSRTSPKENETIKLTFKSPRGWGVTAKGASWQTRGCAAVCWASCEFHEKVRLFFYYWSDSHLSFKKHRRGLFTLLAKTMTSLTLSPKPMTHVIAIVSQSQTHCPSACQWDRRPCATCLANINACSCVWNRQRTPILR